MRKVWTEQNKFDAYLRVEILASEAWSQLGPAHSVFCFPSRAGASSY